MKPVVYLTLLLSLFGLMPAAWGGPAEDIAAIGSQQGAAGAKGDLDAFVAPFADNAVVTAFWIPFRVEGKAAIKDQFAVLFEKWPTRRILPRHNSVRSYANDTVAVTNRYATEYLTDKGGNTSVHHTRLSQTWVKIGTDWKIVDQHASRVPIPD